MWGDFINKKFVIYKVTNKINGKIYIGKTYNFEKRRREHIYDIENGLPFHRALKNTALIILNGKLLIQEYPTMRSKKKRYIGQKS